jgi:hypothetical protein
LIPAIHSGYARRVGALAKEGFDDMRLPRQLFIVTGITAIIGAIALGGLSFTAPGASAGNGCPPTSTPDPVPTGSITAGIVQAFGEDPCPSPTDDGPPFTHTPTTGPTEEPEPTEPVATTAPTTPVPPAATSTPSGGAGGGGVQPPSTGSGGSDGAASSGMWVLAAFGLLAGGLGSLAYGMRRSN